MSYRSGRHFLQIPGPTNVPDRVLRALAAPTIDHRGPEFAALARAVLSGLKPVFRTTGPVVAFPASGTGAWEAALVNTLSPGDRVIAFDTGHFAGLWSRMAGSLGLEVDLVPGSWRRGVDPALVHERLATDRTHAVRAVMVVHNETSTGVTSDVPVIRAAVDAAGHPALLLVDTVSSLASIDYRHDEWGVDVTVSCSQKGLMLPPGLGFNALGERALAASASAGLPRSYWDWQPMLAANADGHFPYTPPTNLLYGLREALAMLAEEGLENVLARHRRHAEATRLAVRLGAGGPVPGPGQVLQLAHGRAGRCRQRRRRGQAGGARTLRPVARRGLRPPRRTRVPHRPPRGAQRPHARRNALRD